MTETLAWTGAAVFGDCAAYQDLSIADPGSSRADPRTGGAAVCRAIGCGSSG